MCCLKLFSLQIYYFLLKPPKKNEKNMKYNLKITQDNWQKGVYKKKMAKK